MAENTDILIHEAGEQTGLAIKTETLDFTGYVQHNFKEGRLINSNVQRTVWPKKKTELET